ncbi:hypothetical protein [Hymenobacter arizonensis]|uniref:Uncharacterized protein n=1 Tax=Hymenobacter arizonensis TaxID=1227077 RepID=A0A1I6BNH1_HYMAR|nr:hypothetical protein [Hymenobacter arizonensis]SFQ82473.1 hypothetical protein SAMN04515668_4821 [Hymenobacter arizonensis]
MPRPPFRTVLYAWVLPPVVLLSARYYWQVFGFFDHRVSPFPSPLFQLCFAAWTLAVGVGCWRGARWARGQRGFAARWLVSLAYLAAALVHGGWLVLLGAFSDGGSLKT